MMRLVAVFLLPSAANAFTVTPSRAGHFISVSATAADDVPFTEKASTTASAAETTTTTTTTASAKICHTLSRHDGRALMDSTLFPAAEYGYRIESGRDAQGLVTGVAVSPNDSCLSLTYGEFPLSSLDELLDLALPNICSGGHKDDNATCMLDLGSGCGRLALYVAMTRGTREQPWHVHGIEISPILHDLATEALLSRGYQTGTFTNDYYYQQQQDNDGAATTTTANSIHLHLGAVDEWTQVLQQCNLVFAYSTVFRTSGFSQEWGAMIMDKEWSSLLSKNCQSGCVVITTDRALDPKDGWHLVDRLDVENREVMGSTGYIHVLGK